MRNKSSTVNKKYSKVPLKSTTSLQPAATAPSPLVSNIIKPSPKKLASPRTPNANSNLNLNFTSFQIKTGFTPNLDGILLENFTSPNTTADSQGNSASNIINNNHGSANNTNREIIAGLVASTVTSIITKSAGIRGLPPQDLG
nr:AIF_HP1_G0030490.mRNA.1.CDS.1 [Saccharomyces cerevisiae]